MDIFIFIFLMITMVMSVKQQYLFNSDDYYDEDVYTDEYNDNNIHKQYNNVRFQQFPGSQGGWARSLSSNETIVMNRYYGCNNSYPITSITTTCNLTGYMTVSYVCQDILTGTLKNVSNAQALPIIADNLDNYRDKSENRFNKFMTNLWSWGFKIVKQLYKENLADLTLSDLLDTVENLIYGGTTRLQYKRLQQASTVSVDNSINRFRTISDFLNYYYEKDVDTNKFYQSLYTNYVVTLTNAQYIKVKDAIKYQWNAQNQYYGYPMSYGAMILMDEPEFMKLMTLQADNDILYGMDGNGLAGDLESMYIYNRDILLDRAKKYVDSNGESKYSPPDFAMQVCLSAVFPMNVRETEGVTYTMTFATVPWSTQVLWPGWETNTYKFFFTDRLNLKVGVDNSLVQPYCKACLPFGQFWIYYEPNNFDGIVMCIPSIHMTIMYWYKYYTNYIYASVGIAISSLYLWIKFGNRRKFAAVATTGNIDFTPSRRGRPRGS